MNKLFFGDNLDVLREKVKDESVDLVYLDPPFNSKANYNVFFKDHGEAQAEAFRDNWYWGEAAALAYDDIMREGGDVATLLQSFRTWLNEDGTMAYLAMMAVRLIELKRALKRTGAIYLHCDPSASHYLKIIMDTIFGESNFRNEVIWKRTPFAGSSKSRAKQLPRSHDCILFFSNGPEWIWNAPTAPYTEKYLERFKWDDDDGRGPYRKTLLKTYSEKTFERLKNDDRLIFPIREGAMYSYKQYLRESRGTTQIDDIWSDINALNPVARERLGYPTQKPVSLLERIIAESTNEDSVVLDPFCGCGTTIDAAEKLGRNWLGIDVTHYAVTLIETRLRKNHPSASYEIAGRPTDFAGAIDLARRDKYQFQWWAAWLLGAQAYQSKKGADRGIDGTIFFKNGPYGMGRIIVSVKGGDHVSPAMVRELSGVVQRDNAEMGVLVTLAEPTAAMKSDAAGSGFVGKSAHGRLPRIQILTVKDLMAGRLPNLPPIPRPAALMPRAPRKKRNADQMEMLLPLPGDKVMTEDGIMIDPRFLDFARA